jgi:hypothetical protein
MGDKTVEFISTAFLPVVICIATVPSVMLAAQANHLAQFSEFKRPAVA